MKKFIIAALLALASLTAFGQTVVQAEKTNEGADLCFHKQIQLKGYAYANVIGRCAWDPALNGMNLSIVAVTEDPTQDAHKIELDYIRDVKLVQNKSEQAQITVIQDTMNENGDVRQIKKVIYVRAIDAKKGTFSVNIK